MKREFGEKKDVPRLSPHDDEQLYETSAFRKGIHYPQIKRKCESGVSELWSCWTILPLIASIMNASKPTTV